MQDLIEHSLKQNMNKDEAIELISQVEIEPNFTKLGNENFRPVAMTCFSFFLSQFYFTPTSFCQTLVCSIVSNTKKKKFTFVIFFPFILDVLLLIVKLTILNRAPLPEIHLGFEL